MPDERDTSMPNVATIAPQHRSIEVPDELQALPGWLVWRYEQHPGEPKPRKVPYYVDGGRRYGVQGSPQDRGKLTTFAMARDEAMKRNFDGIGLALMPDWGVTALDFDKCVGPNGAMPYEIVEIIGDTYSEYSPSGEGVRAFVRGNLGNNKSYAEGDRYGFETFNTNGFVTITGRHTPYCEIMGLENTVAPASDYVIDLAARRFTRSASSALQDDPADFMIGHEPKLGLTVERMQELLGELDSDMSREDWIRVGMALHHECEGDDTGFELWDDWSSDGLTYPGTEGLRGQWESFDRRVGNGHRQVTMASVIKMAKQAGAAPVNPLKATTADDLRRVVAESADTLPVSTNGTTPPEYTGRFRIHHAAEIAARPPGKWWIKGLIPEARIGAIFGASGSGKSFCVIDLMAHLSLGWDWRGLKTRQGRVLYVVAEGGTGAGKRIKAWCQHHNVPETSLNISILLAPPNIMLRQDIEDLVVAIKAAGGFEHIVLDTYAQVTPGANENTAEDMSLALGHCAAIGDATEAEIHLVHHSGKDATKGARGWSGINAALDYSIEVTRDPDTNYREMRVSKMKDGEDGMRYAFKLEVLEVGLDDDGDAITSCVAVEADVVKPDEGKPSRGVKKLGRVETHIVETIETQVDPFVSDMVMSDFIQLCVDGMPAPEPNRRDVRRQDVQRALRSLTKGDSAPIDIKDGKVIFMTS